MNKIELNDKLAELYNIEKTLWDKVLLIDDWSRLMDLAVDNRLHIDIFDVFTAIFWLSSKDNSMHHEENKKHESPQAATRFAIAMALVKLKEDK